MADKAHAETDEKLERMERHLSAIYSKARHDVGKKWTAYLEEVGKEIASLQKDYRKAKKSGDAAEIKKAGVRLAKAKKEKTLLNARYRNLTQKLCFELLNVNRTALAYVNGQLPEVYALNYNALSPQVDGLGGYSFTLTDAETVKMLATENRDLLPYKDVDATADVRWNTKQLNSEVLQGIIRGESMDKIARRLNKTVGMNGSSAIRNARTMVTGAENRGRQESYRKAAADGVILSREWVATEDSRTRKAHALLNGQVVGVEEPFSSELGPIMYPGDHHAKPANVYNCRCTLVADVIGFRSNLPESKRGKIKVE